MRIFPYIFLSIFRVPFFPNQSPKLTQKTLRDWAFNLSCYSAIHKLRLCGCLFSEISMLQLQEISGFFVKIIKVFWKFEVLNSSFSFYFYSHTHISNHSILFHSLFSLNVLRQQILEPLRTCLLHTFDHRWLQVVILLTVFPLHAVNYYHYFLHHWGQDYYVSISNQIRETIPENPELIQRTNSETFP